MNRIAVLVVLAVPLALVLSLSLRADPPRAAAADDPFAGKILTLGSRSTPNFGATLEEVHVKRIGDQVFLVGKGVSPDDTKGWYVGRTVWVPVSELTHIYEFQDRADLIKTNEERKSGGQ
jgi:hypothetical protein